VPQGGQFQQQAPQYQNQNAVPQQPIFQPQPAPTQPVSTKYVPPKKNNKKIVILVSVIVAIVVIGIGAMVLFALNKGHNTQVVATENTTQLTTQMQGMISTESTTKIGQLPTIPEPEDGWARADIRELVKNIEINGHIISFPCKVADFKYALGEEWNYPDTLKNNTNVTRFYFANTNNDKIICDIKNYNSNIEFEENYITAVVIYPDWLKSFSIGGVTSATRENDLKNIFGDVQPVIAPSDEPNVINRYRLPDFEEKAGIVFAFKNGSLYIVAINMEGE
jgi:hypothetical protein